MLVLQIKFPSHNLKTLPLCANPLARPTVTLRYMTEIQLCGEISEELNWKAADGHRKDRKSLAVGLNASEDARPAEGWRSQF